MTDNEKKLIAALQETFQALVHRNEAHEYTPTLNAALKEMGDRGFSQVLGLLDQRRLSWNWEWFDITKASGEDVRCLANLISYCQVMGSVGFTAADGDVANTMPNVLLTAAVAPGSTAEIALYEVRDLAEAVNTEDPVQVLILALALTGTTRKSAQQEIDQGLKTLLGGLDLSSKM